MAPHRSSLTDTPFSPIPWGAAVTYLAVLKSSPTAAYSSFAQSLGTTWTFLQHVITYQDCKQLYLSLVKPCPPDTVTAWGWEDISCHTLRRRCSAALRLHPTEHHTTSHHSSAGTLLPGHRLAMCHDLLSLTSLKSRGMSKHSCSMHE